MSCSGGKHSNLRAGASYDHAMRHLELTEGNVTIRDEKQLILVVCRAKLLPPYTYGPSLESTETVLMRPEDIPFDEV